jgi:putative ABC transport system ATP-binding protein
MIQLSNVSKSYTAVARASTVLREVTLTIPTGQFVAIMGPSGSGKSTLLNLIGCLDTPDSGTYDLFGQRVDQLTEDQLAVVRLRRIGFVFQSFNLIPRYTAVHNVELPMIYARVDPATRTRRAQRALELVGLQERLRHKPSQLSGGQQQRIAIARALVNDPSVIVADEPTGSLDTATGHEIMHLFRRMHAAGKTIVMVTHEADIAAYAQRILYVKDGRVSEGVLR